MTTRSPLASGAAVSIRWHWVKLFLLLVVNLFVLAGLWWLAVAGLGRPWLPWNCDLVLLTCGSLAVSQFLVLMLWSSLSEPRSPWRWFGLVGVCALIAAGVSFASWPPIIWRFVGVGRFNISWGVILWQSYTTFMLLLCTSVALLIAADVLMWPFRRVLGFRVVLEGHAPLTPARRGFGLTEMFWWVGMAAAVCWLLRALLENALTQMLAIPLLVFVASTPAVLPAAAAAMASKRSKFALLAALAWAAAYALAVGVGLAIAAQLNSIPRDPLLAYLFFFPPVLLAAGGMVAALATYLNCSALRFLGIRFQWEMPQIVARRRANGPRQEQMAAEARPISSAAGAD